MRTGDGSEALATRELLLALSVPAAAILLEDGSDNTAPNAARTAQLLRSRGLERPLLVTSALRMARARAQFEQAGLAVTPAPTDFEVIDQPTHLLQWLPSSGCSASSSPDS